MTRLISPALRSGLLIGTGSALILGPVALGLSFAAIVAGIAIGALTVALGLAGTAPSGRGTLPISAQAAYDRGLALGLMVTALVFALGGDKSGAAAFAIAGAASTLIAVSTRYTAQPA